MRSVLAESWRFAKLFSVAVVSGLPFLCCPALAGGDGSPRFPTLAHFVDVVQWPLLLLMPVAVVAAVVLFARLTRSTTPGTKRDRWLGLGVVALAAVVVAASLPLTLGVVYYLVLLIPVLGIVVWFRGLWRQARLLCVAWPVASAALVLPLLLASDGLSDNGMLDGLAGATVAALLMAISLIATLVVFMLDGGRDARTDRRPDSDQER